MRDFSTLLFDQVKKNDLDTDHYYGIYYEFPQEAPMNFMRSIYLAYFSTPPENRALYQAIGRIKPTRIVEFGIQRGVRSLNMLELAKQFHRAEEIEYYGIDPFEGRNVEDGPGLSLRKAYRHLTQSGVKVKPIPGHAEDGLQTLVGAIGKIDLLVVATASLDWVTRWKDVLAEMMNPVGAAYIGISPPDGSPFELQPYTVMQVAKFENRKRRAA